MRTDGCQRITDGVLLTGPSIQAVLYAVEVAQRARARNGLPPSRALVALAAAVSPPGQVDIAVEPTGQSEEVTTAQAASMLDCSARTARRKAPQLGGRLVGGRWLFDRQAVADHNEGDQ